MTRALRIGTRGSPLALWQAQFIAGRLRALVPDLTVELVEIETTGDQVRDVPLAQIGGEGLFTKAIQQAVLAGKADVAVHSLKDLPTFDVEDLVLAAVPERGPTGDALISRRHRSFASLPHGAVLATSSQRRRAQVLHRRPDLCLMNIRGNVETRLRKLIEENLDGIILAQAGLTRLGMEGDITEILDSRWMLPAVGQGALGLECRSGDTATREVLSRLDHAATHQAVLAERALLRGLGGGCSVPIGAATTVHDCQLTLRGAVLAPDGSRRIESTVTGAIEYGDLLGRQLSEELLSLGAQELLQVR